MELISIDSVQSVMAMLAIAAVSLVIGAALFTTRNYGLGEDK